jgi:hypothetical protein
MNQAELNFEAAREAGNEAAAACLDKARRTDPEFVEKAQAAILAHLRAVGSCSGEELVDIAIAKGARPHDQRAFGQVFAGLARKNMIRTVAFCLRRKGRGTAGCRVWALCH